MWRAHYNDRTIGKRKRATSVGAPGGIEGAMRDLADTEQSRGRRLAGNLQRTFRRGERAIEADALRDLRNLRASARALLLAALIAVLVGAAVAALLASLRAATGTREANIWLFALLPLVNVVTVWLYRSHGLRAQRGNNLVIDSALTGTPIHARMALLTFACGTATHLTGGSAGREGAAVQIGGTIASNVAQFFSVRGHDRRDLMMAGISAAFGAAFGTPLAGAFFGMEMCFIGKLDYSAVLYCLTGSFIGNAVSRALGTPFAFSRIGAVPAMTPETVVLTVLAAVAFGLTARLFSLAIRTVKRLYARLFTSYLAAAAVSGLVLSLLFLGLGLTRFGGLSEWMVSAAFAGQTGPFDPMIKLVMTALTVGAGLQGGEVTPLFGIGASLGGWIGNATVGEPSLMAALGMLGVFGAALNVPITTIMLGVDMFGGDASGYFVIVVFVSYLVAGHRAVYPAQRIVTPKRRSLKADALLTVDEAIERHREEVENEFEDDARDTGGEAGCASQRNGACKDGTENADATPPRTDADISTSSDPVGGPDAAAPGSTPSPSDDR